MKLSEEFYVQDTITVAKKLLGKFLVRETPEGICSGMIIETEAYGGSFDAASHVFGNKITERTKIWFEMGGHAYVYTIYGIHYCLGIIAEDRFKPGAVLIRSIVPTDGLELMYKRRKVEPKNHNSVYQLCSGPSKVCQALAIDKTLYGENLRGNLLYIEHRDITTDEIEIGTSPRIGINYAGEAAHYQWRFFVKDNQYLSAKNYKGPKSIRLPVDPIFQQMGRDEEL